VRTDPGIDFQWDDKAPDKRFPNDRFTVEWRGQLVAPASGEYLFSAEVDDVIEIKVGDTPVMQAQYGSKELGKRTLEAGKAVAFMARYREEGGDARARLFWTPPGGTRQLVPRHAFRPENEVAGDPMKVMDPLGLPREAMLRPVRKGRELAIKGPAVPGIYRVDPDEELRSLVDLKTGETLPVAVLRDPAESRFEARTEEDLAMVRGHVDLLQPSSVGDLLGVLQGKGFGREIWKLLALAAFILFLLESLLARWVSRNRRAGEEVRIDFGQDAVWATRK
jgi:hypothetical protein